LDSSRSAKSVACIIKVRKGPILDPKWKVANKDKDLGDMNGTKHKDW
jgi:hypothetical protein